ncbi:MAG: PAS domain S-box protein [Candidatus Bathyarchaeota archaeon]|nr:PAS domain S-box protein [Candidatus Bathyarchaeota archaeon]
MPAKPQKMTEQEFNRLFLEAIDETLSALGESAKTAIYFHLEQKFKIERDTIPRRVDKFTKALAKLFGVGSKPMEIMFMRRIHEKIKIDCGLPMKPEEFTLSAYVCMLKQEVVLTKAEAQVSQNKQPTQPTKDRETNFITLLNFIADPVVILDRRGNFLFVNTVFERETGVRCKDWIGRSFLELPNFPETSKMLAMKNLHRRYKGLPVEPYELEVFDPHRALRQFEVNAKTIEFSGQLADIVIFREVTQRNKYEKQLTDYAENLETLVEEKAGEIKKSEEKLRAILNSSPDALMVFDPEAVVTDCNQAAVTLFGFSSKQELIGKNGLDFASAEDRPRILEIAESLAAKGGVSKSIEYMAITKDGREFSGEFSLSVIKGQETPFCFIAATKDISERKYAEEKLVTSERKYRKLVQQLELAQERITHERDHAQDYLDVADVLLLALDIEGNITLLNRKGCAILGCQTAAVLGKNWFDLFVPPEEKAERIRLHKLRINGKTLSFEQAEKNVRCLNGDRRIIAWRHTLIRDSNNVVVGTLSSGEDITDQIKTRQALKASEEKFRRIVENSSDVIMLTRPDRSISYLSPAITELVGYQPEEFYTPNSPMIFHPEDAKRILSMMSKALQGKRGSDYQYRVVTKTGETRWVSHSWSPIIENGKVNLVVSIVRDITERKQLINDLQASEERFRAISTSATDAIILVDEDETVVYWNPASEKIFGYSEKEAVGKKLSDFDVSPPGRAHHLAFARELRRDSSSKKTFEFTTNRRDGTKISIELSLSSMKLKEKNCMLALVRDISERKRMEAALKQERDMLESVASNIGAGLSIISRDYKVLWANRVMKNIGGENLEGKPCYSVFSRSDGVCSVCGVKKVFESGAAVDRHDYHSKLDGRDEWIELIVTPVKDKDGNVVAALELGVNITERKRLESKLAEYSQRLEAMVEQRTAQLKQTQSRLLKSERLAAIGELAGMVGHDLRNPLTSIKGAAYFLNAKYSQSLDDSGREMLVAMDKSIAYSNKIINDLLDYSRELTLELSEETPKALFEAALQLVSVPQNIKVVDKTSDTPQVTVDSAKMNRVFVNLIRNAFESMPKGGTLTVTNRKQKDLWEIRFADTGSGMNKETLSRLWTPLFTTKAKGMGFGLPICNRIVKAHGGEIRVESTVKQGTTFTLTLPIDPKTETEATWILHPSASAKGKIPQTHKNNTET